MRKHHNKKSARYLLLVILVFAVGFAIYSRYTPKATAPSSNTQTVAETQATTPASNTSPAQSITTPTPAPSVVFPIDQFTTRATDNLFGTYYPSGQSSNFDTKVCKNATYYAGYHTATDLETFSSEANVAVPVFAVANGTVREVGPVSGYGGLIVIDVTLGGAGYTALYGHIDLATTTVKAGDTVTAGQHIANLGAACSSANGNVRKHLHFGLHKGSTVDVKGYVPNQNDLSAWANPQTVFADLGLK